MPKPYTQYLPGGNSFPMRYIEGGPFQMGSENGYLDEKPVHTVHLSSFYLAQYPVSQGLWKAVMGAENNPSRFKGDLLPVESVSWHDAQEFIQKLHALSGHHYGLPSEAQWEYAARGGKYATRPPEAYAGSDDISEVAWHGTFITGTSYRAPMPLGLQAPNALGLYDMSGNVWEWCQDWHQADYYQNSPTHNPQGPPEGAIRVLRGGSWLYNASFCRVAYRAHVNPVNRYFIIGFRLSRTA